tara:strand:- start:2671 stop:2952 length:282 start_codon:yes stop_codon:yes gene_type:complete
MVSNKTDYMYEVGDLVELARYGYAPKNDKDRVYGLVVGVIEPIDHFVPRYRIRIQYKSADVENPLDEFILSKNKKIATVMEYDIAGKTEGSQE